MGNNLAVSIEIPTYQHPENRTSVSFQANHLSYGIPAPTILPIPLNYLSSQPPGPGTCICYRRNGALAVTV